MLRSSSVRMLSYSSAAPDTIFALSSGAGKCGVSVIRVSGPSALQCLETVSQSSPPPPRLLTRRKFFHPQTNELLDHGMAVCFPEGASATGEDVAELHVHGSVAVVEGVLDVLGKHPHCRLAEAGEFTRRAFENGKLDLTEVEGIADLLDAETEAQRRQAVRQMEGYVGRIFESWRDEVVSCLAHVEASIDFGEEEDVEQIASVVAAVEARVVALHGEMSHRLADRARGERIRNGLSVVIVGPPNAGKSSILNALAERPAAIVSHVPGTTRDVVSVSLNLGGYPVSVSDTAGIRGEAADAVEEEGIRRAKEQSAKADINVLVLDGSVPPSAELLAAYPEALVVLNKSDLDMHAAVREWMPSSHRKVFGMSCSTGCGLPDFVEALTESVRSRLHTSEAPVVTRARHRQHLLEAVGELEQFVRVPFELDLKAEHLRAASSAIGRVTGRVDVEGILAVIFRDFCIGK